MTRILTLTLKDATVLAMGWILNGCIGDGVQNLESEDEMRRIDNEMDRRKHIVFFEGLGFTA